MPNRAALSRMQMMLNPLFSLSDTCPIVTIRNLEVQLGELLTDWETPRPQVLPATARCLPGWTSHWHATKFRARRNTEAVPSSGQSFRTTFRIEADFERSCALDFDTALVIDRVFIVVPGGSSWGSSSSGSGGSRVVVVVVVVVVVTMEVVFSVVREG